MEIQCSLDLWAKVNIIRFSGVTLDISKMWICPGVQYGLLSKVCSQMNMEVS